MRHAGRHAVRCYGLLGAAPGLPDADCLVTAAACKTAIHEARKAQDPIGMAKQCVDALACVCIPDPDLAVR